MLFRSTEKIQENQYDEQISLGSLMKFFRNNSDDFKKTKFPYLLVDKNKTNKYKKIIKNKKNIACGISWKSSNQQIGEYKSIDLKKIENIFERNEINYVNLQYKGDEPNINEQEIIDEKLTNIDNLDVYNDLDSLAALIEACNFVITTSNTTAHLSGALHKQTFLLLPIGLLNLYTH